MPRLIIQLVCVCVCVRLRGNHTSCSRVHFGGNATLD
jgi:hypothetical protein